MPRILERCFRSSFSVVIGIDVSMVVVLNKQIIVKVFITPNNLILLLTPCALRKTLEVTFALELTMAKH